MTNFFRFALLFVCYIIFSIQLSAKIDNRLKGDWKLETYDKSNSALWKERRINLSDDSLKLKTDFFAPSNLQKPVFKLVIDGKISKSEKLLNSDIFYFELSNVSTFLYIFSDAKSRPAFDIGNCGNGGLDVINLVDRECGSLKNFFKVKTMQFLALVLGDGSVIINRIQRKTPTPNKFLRELFLSEHYTKIKPQ